MRLLGESARPQLFHLEPATAALETRRCAAKVWGQGAFCNFVTHSQVFNGSVTFTNGGLSGRNALPRGDKARQAFHCLQQDSVMEGTLLTVPSQPCRVGGALQVKAPEREAPRQQHPGPSLRQSTLVLQNLSE